MKHKKKSKLQLAQDAAQASINKTNEKIEELGENTSKLYDSLTEIQGVFDRIRNVPSDKKLEYEELKKVRLNWKKQAEKIEKDYKEAEVKGTGAGATGVGVGMVVVTMGPTVAMGVATTFGVASTGTAISTLSGAAATNAALAWLGGGALAAGGGGMAAGEAFLTLSGPVGWALAVITLLASGLFMLKTKSDKKHIENIFTLISERDVNSYELAIVELNERINRIKDETNILFQASVSISSFGFDYNEMTEAQQYELGSYVNLMQASTQLLVNPVLGLQPKYSEQDFRKYTAWKHKKASDEIYSVHKELIISLANFLYKIELNDKDKKLLWKTLRKNKKLLKSLNESKKEFNYELMEVVYDALKYCYISDN